MNFDMELKARQIIKARMMDDRRNAFGAARCDYCGERSDIFHMHEIIGRNRTIKQPQIRKYTYAIELCALLCDSCHLNRPITSKAAHQKFFDILYALYTPEAVKQALGKIPTQYLSGIWIPEMMEDEKAD